MHGNISQTGKRDLEQFHVVGLSYAKTDAATRGRFSFFEHLIDNFVERAKAAGYDAFFILSTCNRTELYFFGNSSEKIMDAYCQTIEQDLATFSEITFEKTGRDALMHLFRVSSGVESQILGDFEVLYQMRKSFKQFKAAGCSSALLERFLDTAVKISKQIKTETRLSDGAASVSYAAVQYIIQNIPDFNQKSIVLFGAGKIGRNTCENLVKHSDNNHITVVNRTHDRAVDLGSKLHVSVKPIEQLNSLLQSTDILIVSTGSPEPTVIESMIGSNPITILDLSMPENVSAGVKELPNVNVVNVDELSKIIKHTMAERSKDIPKVETIIRLAMWEFEEWYALRQYVPAIEAFKARLDFLHTHEKKQLSKKNIHINDSEKLSQRLIRKMTNQFASHLMANPAKADEIISLMDEMFHLQIQENT
ncbi:MAG: glutamyl-tRNA reductase [Weeksellaceae bacterium]|nr:glutamyl-tRNA reductase [Weeksellaceae bacterium]